MLKVRRKLYYATKGLFQIKIRILYSILSDLQLGFEITDVIILLDKNYQCLCDLQTVEISATDVF